MANNNMYEEPTAGTSIATARIRQNENFRSILSSFYGDAIPTSANLNASGNPLAIPNGMIFRNSTNGGLYIADSTNARPGAIGGGFTRVGIGARVENTVTDLTNNAGDYEIGELVVTLDTNNEKLYLCKGTGGLISDFKDIGTPATYLESGSDVTIQSTNFTVSNLIATGSATLQGNATVSGTIYTSAYITHSGDTDTYFGFPTTDQYKVRVGNADKLFITTTSITIKDDLILDTACYIPDYIHHVADNSYFGFNAADQFVIATANQVRFQTTNTTTTINNALTVNSNITATGSITSSSDIRLKSNIQDIPNALALVGDMRGVYYDKDGSQQVGVIAQEIEQVLPQVVTTDEYKSVAYGNIVGVLIEAIKELKAEVEELKK